MRLITPKIILLFTLLLQFNLLESKEIVIYPSINDTKAYIPYLKGKRLAIVANQTSCFANKTHLVDSLHSLNLDIKKIFSPEHGFRGAAQAGELVGNNIDRRTNIEVVSLYGSNKKPNDKDLDNIDIVLFDLQDVGVRFYTYISTLHYVMEACAENNIEVIVLDRPNPNANYIDGPVLDTALKSFVGMHKVPIVYGLTIGEYALMINGENYLKNGIQCDLRVISMENYTHNTYYELPINPSPNLRSMLAIRNYPSLCFFEGTIVSLGRGTDRPFECFGYPKSTIGNYRFTPKAIGEYKPPYVTEECVGFKLDYNSDYRNINRLDLSYLINMYNASIEKDKFFNNFFNKLAGNAQLQAQIKSGVSEEKIRLSWQADLDAYKKIRVKYLLYK